MTQLVKNAMLLCWRPQFHSWVGEIHWRRDRLPTPIFLGFPCGSVGKEATCNVEDLGLIPGLGRSTGERKGYPCQCSGLENSMDCIVHGVAKNQIRLSKFHFHNGKETFFCQRTTASTLFPFLKDLAPSVTPHPLILLL